MFHLGWPIFRGELALSFRDDNRLIDVVTYWRCIGIARDGKVTWILLDSRA